MLRQYGAATHRQERIGGRERAVGTIDETFRLLGTPRQVGTIALIVLALFAAGLAAAGIYSVVSYGVSERTREIGVRIAIGAPRAAVRRLVIRQTMTPVIVGGSVGLLIAFALGSVIGGLPLLFGISPRDPLTFAVTTLLLLAVAVAASYFPARRASRLDPTVALRYD